MEQSIIQTLYVDNIEPKGQGQAININSSSSSGQSVNLMGSLLYNSSYANQGTVNYGRQLIICGHFVSSTLTLNQSGGINTIGNPATGQYQLSFPVDLFTTQPYAIVSPANASSG